MSIELTTKFSPYVDEVFAAESKLSLITNNAYVWDGAHTIKAYRISTAGMNDYDRDGSTLTGEKWSRYGVIENLDALTQEMTLTRDRSFAFALDKMDIDETGNALNAADALARQSREVVVPEIDQHVYSVMTANAGTKPAAIDLSEVNIWTQIMKANEALDNAMVPETNRYLIVTPVVFSLLKHFTITGFVSDIGDEMRKRGVIAMIDGLSIVRVPAVRLPEKFGFMVAHPSATVAPVKLAEFKMHTDPPGISGVLCEGRFVYDAFVLTNKSKGIYYQEASSIVYHAGNNG